MEDFGHFAEGVVEQDPLSDRFVIRYQAKDGTWKTFDPQAALEQYDGKEVRMTLATLETLQRLSDMVGDAGQQIIAGPNLRDIVG